MDLEFELNNIVTVEFGVGRDDGDAESYVLVPAQKELQSVLQEIVVDTWEALQASPDGPERYQPSEKYGSIEYLHLPIDDDLAVWVRQLHESASLLIDSGALADPEGIFCYFARLTDDKNRRLTGLRRAGQFKSIVKSRNRIVRQWNDRLYIVEDTLFKLDNDFDLLVDPKNVHILRPSGFEFTGKLQDAILHAVPTNVATIRSELPFVDFDGIEEYASSRTRAARLIASIRSQFGGSNVSKDRLINLCKQTGVEVNEAGGKLDVAVGSEMGFLEVLDRRRYEINLVENEPERFRATGRSKIDV